ncbi:MAG TPA: bacteriohopanetetrol glucosamine biosynthesis glycosyltransferase HpnI [Xanthobacteraceae bacterium]|jgi:ceramide glucosyltransferase|nr:bacteriohopanetetrol glucosamine biosynthesis glycosyltransferase HpnI [Xanthobacteraceae bacterium]
MASTLSLTADLAPTVRVVGDLFVAGAIAGSAFTIITCIIVMSVGSSRRPVATVHPPVTILKPLHGAEPGLYARLAAFCTQDYAGPVQLVLGVQAASDPAIKIVRELQARYPDLPIVLQVDPREHGSNRKLSNLINMLSLAQHETLVISDSDIEVGPNYLAQVVAALENPSVGAASCLYYGVADDSLSGRLAALAINIHFLPQVIAALRMRLARPCFGATIALRRGMLNRIGGFRAFRDVLADDYAIGAAVRAAGYEVPVLPLMIGHVCLDGGMRPTLVHQLRIARTIRLIEPRGYAGTIVAHPFALAVLAALTGVSGSGMLIGLALCCRFALCACVRRTFGLPPQPYWLIPIHDLLAFAIYVVSFAGTTVTWRGLRYRVADDGSMVEDTA